MALWARPWIEALPVPASVFCVAHRRVLANSFRSNETPCDVDVSEHMSCDVWAVFLFGFIGYDSWVHRLLYLRYAAEPIVCACCREHQHAYLMGMSSTSYIKSNVVTQR